MDARSQLEEVPVKTRLLLPLITLATLVTPLFAGPPWISIELPANPFDPASRGAFLLVHTFHHSNTEDEPVAGRAVGIVDGQRRNLTLAFEQTTHPGVLALKNSWGDKGEWSLIISDRQPGHDAWVAEVMVRVSGGRVVGVEAATKPSKFAQLAVEPRRFTDAEIEASLGGRSRP
jgi:hypothetical protein